MSRIPRKMNRLGEVQISRTTQLRPIVFVFFLFLVGFLFSWYPSKLLLLLPLIGTPFVLTLSNHYLVLKKSPLDLKVILKKYILFDEFIWLIVGTISLSWLMGEFSWWQSILLIGPTLFFILGKDQLYFLFTGRKERIYLRGRSLVIYAVDSSEVLGHT